MIKYWYFWLVWMYSHNSSLFWIVSRAPSSVVFTDVLWDWGLGSYQAQSTRNSQKNCFRELNSGRSNNNECLETNTTCHQTVRLTWHSNIHWIDKYEQEERVLCWTKSFLLKLFPQSVSETILVYFIYFQELCFLCLKLNQRQMCQVFLRGSALGREQKENLCVLNGCKREGLCWGHIHKVWKEGSLECYQPPTLLLLSPDAKGSWLPLICALQ